MEDKLNEEAVAEAYRAYRKEGARGIIGRIFDKLRNALSAIASAFRREGFHTPEDFFRPDARDIFGPDARNTVGDIE